MEKINKSKIGKYFLYAKLVAISVFIMYIVSVFISKQPNIMEWYVEGRAAFLLWSIIMFLLIKNWKNIFS